MDNEKTYTKAENRGAPSVSFADSSLREGAASADDAPEAETPAPEQEGREKPVQTPQERARQAAGRRLRERTAAARSEARAEIEETLRKRGVVDPRTGRPLETLEDLEREAPDPEPLEESRVQAELEEIRRLDPEMEDLGCILRSEAGERFRRYVRRGLNFVEAYELAARDRLEGLRTLRSREAARLQAASKDHLAATATRGQGALPVPREELALYRELLPEATEAEIRRHYNTYRRLK